MDKLTLKLLKKLLYYNHLTGIFTWKVSNNRRVKVGDIAGCKHHTGYIVIYVNNKQHLAHHLAWFYIYGVWPDNQLDHEDHIRHHNWISNLKEATHQENHCNRTMQSNNTSGFTGVYECKQNGKWQASIIVKGKSKSLGYFKKKKDAIAARKAANIKYGFHKNHGK